jgi:hypothetical protein
MSGTFWYAPEMGATLGELRRRAGRFECFDPKTDGIRTSLSVTEHEWDDRDFSRLDEVERRVREHGRDGGF